MADIKQSVQSQFGKVAENYRLSTVHAAGEDLQRIVQLIAEHPAQHALDAGCGAGHTAAAIAPYAEKVVAFDLTPLMLEQVEALAAERGLTNLTTKLGDIENLPFEDNSFDLVTSRYSAHHWPHPQTALNEIARVLQPGGRFIFSDIVAPDDPAHDTFLQAIELLRDPSHVRDHSIRQWQAIFAEAGFECEVVFTWLLPLNFDSWVARMATPPLNVEMLKVLYDGASSEIRAAMQIQPDYTFSIPGALFVGKPI
ncbi:MAG TPA: methyltransferase domain-containing protein [Spirillospora sp.]|nr:methyltransferase domain-containing protein [Spirillospora sp.]